MEIISKEMIKPSSPTPQHLRNLKLSFIDQIAPPTHSLSNVLTFFYPLAGTIQQDSSINCNDSGAEFVEARVHTRLSQVLEEPIMSELEKFRPLEPERVVLAVKISLFECGGIAVAICLSHKIADGISLMTFMNAWAAACRGETNNIFQPSFDFPSVFPPRDLSGLGFSPNVGLPTEKIVTKRFVFDKDKVAELKKSGVSSQVKDPTRVEVVSAYIWQCFMKVDKAKSGTRTTSFEAVHAVNLRPRKRPPLSQHAFGNCCISAVALFDQPHENNDNYSDLVAKLRVSITSIDDEYIKKIENGEYLNNLSRLIDYMYHKEGIDQLLNFSSWCRFGVYEVDFGWGKPDWVCTTSVPLKNVVILMDTPCGEGIEAWISMLQDDIKMLQDHI